MMVIMGKDWVYQKSYQDDFEAVELNDLGSDELLQLAVDLTASLNEVMERLYNLSSEVE